jgi:hypothetical protein
MIIGIGMMINLSACLSKGARTSSLHHKEQDFVIYGKVDRRELPA